MMGDQMMKIYMGNFNFSKKKILKNNIAKNAQITIKLCHF